MEHDVNSHGSLFLSRPPFPFFYPLTSNLLKLLSGLSHLSAFIFHHFRRLLTSPEPLTPACILFPHLLSSPFPSPLTPHPSPRLPPCYDVDGEPS